MPRYSFAVPDDPQPIWTELPDREAAWGEAVTFCGEILRDINGSMPSNTDWRMQVTDEAGQPVVTLEIRAVLHEP